MRFYIETYGCQMNVAESDSLKRLLAAAGHTEASEPSGADVVILNTCSVRLTAEQRIEGRIGFYRGLNEKLGKRIRVALMGCMAENTGLEMQKRFPDVVSAVWGSYHKEGILRFVDDPDRPVVSLDRDAYDFLAAEAQEKFPFKAFVPISHGCNNYCAYCIVPYVRGPEVHRPAGDILDNVKRLVDDGVVEVCLLGQNVNSYRDGGIEFASLLHRVAGIPGVKRLTFLTSHPKDFNRSIAEAMADRANVMPFLHLPLQAGSDAVLTAMNRKYTSVQYFEKIELARSVPDITLTTDLLVGFPGETDEDFERTLEAVKRVRYHEAYMYRYNKRPGTKASEMPGQVPERVKLERLARLIELQTSITKELLPGHAGKVYDVLCEAVSRKNKGQLTCRTHNGIMAFVPGGRELVGKIVRMKVTGVSGTGLVGERMEDKEA